MTRFAAPLLLETPCCQSHVIQRRFASINTFGLASRWSDGYRSFPLVSDAASLAYCAACKKIYWIDEATPLGIAPQEANAPQRTWPPRRGWWNRTFSRLLGGKDEGSDFAKEMELWLASSSGSDKDEYLQHPRPDELLFAVQGQQWATPARETHLRTWLWWIGNHRQRGMTTDSPMSMVQAVENMSALLALHQIQPATDEITLQMGELLRQLSRFDEAAVMLEGLAERNSTAAAILAAVLKKETEVFELERF